MTAHRNWKLQDAKSAFSEVVRKAQSEGPQHVTVRGKEACVVVSAAEYERMTEVKPRRSLLESLRGLGMDELDLSRPQTGWRDEPP